MQAGCCQKFPFSKYDHDSLLSFKCRFVGVGGDADGHRVAMQLNPKRYAESADSIHLLLMPGLRRDLLTSGAAISTSLYRPTAIQSCQGQQGQPQ